MKEIRITCTGSDYIHYKDLLPLQGNIKSLPKKNKIALRKSIIENGFMAPIFIWNSDNGKYILAVSSSNRLGICGPENTEKCE